MVKEASGEASYVEGTTCKGVLYFSSSIAKKASNRKPVCVGVSRRVNVLPLSNIAKHGRILSKFRYTCVGRSVYRTKFPPADSMRQPDLPVCDGLLIFEKAPETPDTDAARQEQLNKNNQQSNQGAPTMHRPPIQKQPSRGVAPEEFGTRFVRSAGMVAGALKENAYIVGNHLKSLVEDLLHQGRSGSK